MKIQKNQSAFTLLELVLVIVILGILVATALPRFADLSGDADASVFVSTRSSFKTAISLVHSVSLIRRTKAGFPDVMLEDQCIQVDILTGYPSVDQTTGTCVAVASLETPTKYRLSEPLVPLLIASLVSTDFFIQSAYAVPPPPPPPPIAGELPSLLINSDFTDWVWTKTALEGTLTSPNPSLFFIYNQNTGAVN